MSNKRKLWQIFGPVICAFILLALLFLIPWHRNVKSDKLLFKASVSQSQNVFKGQEIKQAAFSKQYVPFYGSSELSRMDPMHPSVLAYKYKRDYRPFLLGGPGSQSLTHFFSMQETVNQLANKKAVFIISPQWFTKQGQNAAAFGMYFSQLQAVNWILNAKDSVATRYAARRLLDMPSGNSSESTKYALMTLASGKKLSEEQVLWLKARRRILTNEDSFFSSMELTNNVPKIQNAAHKLPGTYAYDNLRQEANAQGKAATSSNPFGISNSFFKNRLNKKELGRLKGSQKDFDYTQSPECADFELVLNEFAKEHVNVLFVIPPVNEKWAKYTGLSQKMYQTSVSKIKQQLTSQGFDNIADLSRDGGKKFFMEDTIHLGWNGWLAVDQYVRPFMKEPNIPIDYHLNNYYYTKAWGNKTNVKQAKVLSAKQQENNQIRKALADNNFEGSVLVVKNNKTTLQYANGWANAENKVPNRANTSYLIDSVQKPMTGVMLMREVQKGNVKLSDKLSKFYPQVPHADEITLRQLTQMTSGLAVKPKTVLGISPYKDNQAGIKHDIKNIVFLPKLYNKRTYSPINYALIAGVLEKVTGRSYEDLFTDTFIKKLDLKETAFVWSNPKKLKQIHFATSYQYTPDDKTTLVPVSLNVDELHGEFGTGSVVMSNHDLYKALKAMVDGKLLTKHSRDELFQGSSDTVKGGNYGGGFYNFSTFHSTNGMGYGYTCYARISNDGKSALIVQSNHPIKSYYGLRNITNQLMAGLVR
ncbi:D-alanyl-lipoteichoic acid biosynthesis protein DltD [uncultured Lactobacillus sp.]|uniref:D-alanyl-lipoteichoic acid biosynthesis protein DltD n=1 Tax=uncultured Lactobacillus sp. TaxID=153152 RepID=UPI002619E256|nr:D-alanyl-lipoteichoic acid biosynthesis protein DltD [uncultured Lactobacillus sp.]